MHLIIHCPMSEGVSEVSERKIEAPSNFSFTAFGHLLKTELVNQFLSGFFLSVKQHLYILI